MAGVKKDILKMFKQLKEEEFKEFKWHLENEPIPGDPRAVPPSDLQNADRMDTVDLMERHYGTDSAQLATTVLEEMQKNDLAEILSKTTSVDFCELTIDTNTVNKNLKLSHNNRKVTNVKEVQSYPDHPDRFDCYQLLCGTGLTGRCYWEVEWSGRFNASVNYGGIKRKGDSEACWFGYNDQSWYLECSDIGYIVRHKGTETRITSSSCSFPSGRVAVYVDWPAGSLSFYTVSSDRLIHIYTFNTTFTEPLYAGFGLWYSGCSMSLCSL
ncbi:stonustoxin subunit alpha-like isoform X2 [Pungitius pungitius]|uniref:stonustoxin subunit alpha-like isoform X2 n=1 Tax=Pungitius pungitius TaxID=134920 RepID=UPI002E1144E9